MGKRRNRSRSPGSIIEEASARYPSAASYSKLKSGNDQLHLLSLFFAISPLQSDSILPPDHDDLSNSIEEEDIISQDSNNNNNNTDSISSPQSEELPEGVNGKEEEEELEETPIVVEQFDDQWWKEYLLDDGCDVYESMEDDYDDGYDIFDKTLFNYKKGGIVERSTKDNKKDKVNPKRYINGPRHYHSLAQQSIQQSHYLQRKIHSAKLRGVEYQPYIPRYVPPSSYNPWTPSSSTSNNNRSKPRQNTTSTTTNNNNNNTSQEDEQLRRALEESARQFASQQGLTQQQFIDIQTRELTPEDYEILLLLDQSVKPKTLSTDAIGKLSSQEICEDMISKLNEERCTICLIEYEVGDMATVLPNCQHRFHHDCVTTWLSTSGTNCPLCKVSLEL